MADLPYEVILDCAPPPTLYTCTKTLDFKALDNVFKLTLPFKTRFYTGLHTLFLYNYKVLASFHNHSFHVIFTI